MTLEDQLLNEFAKTMNAKEDDVETTAVGTIISVTRASETQLYDICTVRLDGANVDTPARMGVDGKVNDRVTVRIRKHKATVTGNLTSPGYTNTDKIDGIGNYASLSYLSLHYLDSDFITTHYLDSDFIETHYLTADEIRSDYITAGTIEATYATITNLNAANAEITSIKADYVKTVDLEADYIKASIIAANYAQIDLGNIANGTIKSAMIDTGAIGTAQIADGSITDAKIVGLTASKITSGTIDAGVINVVNLDAANITVGTINGVQIANNAINMNKLSTELANYVTDASETAHRKNRVYHQDSAPQDTDLIPGDTWFDTSNGFKMYRCVESGNLTDENGNVLTDENGNPLTAVRWEEERYSTSAIAAKAITTEHLTAGCITAEQIVARAISADKIAAKSITANEIMAETITASEIKAQTITAAQIAAGTITADKINVTDLFAQDITATGTIRGVELIAASGTFTGRIEFNWNSNPAYRTILKIGSPLSAESPIFLSQADSAGTVTSKTFIYGSLIKLKNASGDRYTELYNNRLDVLHEINSNDVEFVSIFSNEVYVANNISGVSHVARLTVNGVQLGSDVRLKENIVSFDPALGLYIRPVSFNYKGDSLQHYGFIAQEVQKIIPDAVSEGRSGYLSLNYQELIAPTLALAQYNARRLDALERRYS